MRRSTHVTLASLLAVAAVVTLGSAAVGKEGGIATLAAPLPRDAEPGSTITVHWSVKAFNGSNGELGPLSATGVYIRLIGLDVSEVVGREEAPGQYVADVVVPKGGIKSAEFGVRGTATMPDGSTTPSNMVFQFDGILLQGAVPPVVKPGDAPAAEPTTTTPTPAPTPSPINPLFVLGVLALVLGGIGALLTVRRRTTIA